MPLSQTSQRVAAAVRAEMARLGWSQNSLASEIGRDQHYISRRVSGKVAFDTEDLALIATALGVPLSTLLVDDEKASA